MEWGTYLSRGVFVNNCSSLKLTDHIMDHSKTTNTKNTTNTSTGSGALNVRARGRTKSADSQLQTYTTTVVHIAIKQRNAPITSIRPQDHIKAKYNNLTGGILFFNIILHLTNLALWAH